MPFAMHDLKLTEKGFRIVFTKPVDRKLASEPDNYTLERWGYLYQPKYGSPKTEVMREKPGKVRVSDDGLTVELETTLQTDRVYKFSLDPIRAEDGSTMVILGPGIL